MDTNQQQPAIFWVVGTTTNVGKTTVATALVKYLNAHGTSAVGFKPVAGSRFRDHADFALEHYPRLPGRVFGRDALLLACASPLTQEADVDLVAPWQLLFHRTIDDTLLIRAGSTQLHNVRYFTTQAGLTVMARADFARLTQMQRLPLDAARVFDPLTEARHDLAPDAQSAAFAALLERRPAAVVVEGAGPFIPTWKGTPRVNHVLAVSDDEILLYPRANAQVPHPVGKSRSTTRQLLQVFAKRGLSAHRVPQRIVESSNLDEAMDQTLGALLTAGGLCT